jgi:tRNA nucleotidyltransferase (CCA-adding enzyme)
MSFILSSYFSSLFTPLSSLTLSLQISHPSTNHLQLPLTHNISFSVSAFKSKTTPTHSEIYHILHPLTLESAILSCALLFDDHNSKNHFHLFWSSLRHEKVLLNGGDLKRMGLQPGPLYAKVFTELLDAKLNGRVVGKEGEIEFVKEFVKLA